MFELWISVIANSASGGQCGTIFISFSLVHHQSSIIEGSGDCQGLSYGMKPHDLKYSSEIDVTFSADTNCRACNHHPLRTPS